MSELAPVSRAVSAVQYGFRPLERADLPVVRRWLEMPHVREWWGEADEQLAIVSGDLDVPTMAQLIVTADGRPFGYLQTCDVASWPDPVFADQPRGTYAIDQLIGEPDMIGKGHGSAFIRAFVDRLLAAGAPRVITDPHPANGRAIGACAKAGFREARLVDTLDGRALLMLRDNPQRATAQ